MLAVSRRAAQRRGFTLIELMMVLAVGALLMALGASSLGDLLRAQQLRSATGDLFDALALARSQAIARNARVDVLPNDAAGSDWAAGWTVFVDRDGDGIPGAGDEIISVHGPLARGVATAFNFTSPTPPYYIAYNGAGRSCSRGNSGASRLGTLSLFSGQRVRRIKINMLGRVRMCEPTRDSTCDGAAAPP
jgi:type IV fimbrial biogenesis protein FimT